MSWRPWTSPMTIRACRHYGIWVGLGHFQGGATSTTQEACRLPAPTAIFNGRHTAQLTASRLVEDTRLPLAWKAQRELFCLA